MNEKGRPTGYKRLIIGIVIVSIMTPPPLREQWEPFHWNIRLLSRYDSDEFLPWYKSLKIWIGLYVIIWFGIYWRFW